MTRDPVYLDHNAGAPLRREALAAMRPWLEAGGAGNASSQHRRGQQARLAVEEARAEVAALVGAEPSEVVFTSGGTEADNLAVLGAAGSVVSTAIEHPAVEACLAALERRGVSVARVAPEPDGVVSVSALRDAVRADTTLVTVMLASNETGALQPVAELAQALRRRGGSRPLLHTDAVQAAGRVPVRRDELDADLISLSAHKLGGPQGIGALVVRRGAPLPPRLLGGPQEQGRRGGTEPVAAIAGFGAAARLARAEMGRWESVCAPLRDCFEEGVRALRPDAVVHCAGAARLPNTSSVGFADQAAEALVAALDLQGIEISAGAACASGARRPSRALLAMGLPEDVVRGTIRVSFGPGSTAADGRLLIEALERVMVRQGVPR